MKITETHQFCGSVSRIPSTFGKTVYNALNEKLGLKHIYYVLIKENAKEIVLVNRTLERAKRLANDFGIAYRILNKVGERDRCDIILNMRSVCMIGCDTAYLLDSLVTQVRGFTYFMIEAKTQTSKFI